MSEDYLKFRSVEHFGKPSLSNELESNLKSYLDWAFLSIGGWQNITTGTTAPFGGRMDILHEINDRSYSDNTVFQAIRKDWVWETGINYVSPTGGIFNPVDVRVFVGGNLVTTGTSGYTHYINYPLGQVVFDNAQTATVQVQYAYRAVQVYHADDINWWFEVQFDSLNPNDTQWSQNLTSGDFALSPSNRIQLPAVVIEPLVSSSSRPFEIGTLSKYNKQQVIFHVISQDRFTRNDISDYLRLQEGKTIIMYDTSKIYNSGLFPLDERGMRVSGATMYPSFVSNPNLVFNTARFEKIAVNNVKTQHANLHWSTVRAQIEIIA